MAGQDPAGLRFGPIRRPLLLADDMSDQLDPGANDRTLAQSVPGAKLTLYPGAGHGFLFQDANVFVASVGVSFVER
jgi:pimeloyl-ACP methyl ester carboxylesterase